MATDTEKEQQDLDKEAIARKIGESRGFQCKIINDGVQHLMLYIKYNCFSGEKKHAMNGVVLNASYPMPFESACNHACDQLDKIIKNHSMEEL